MTLKNICVIGAGLSGTLFSYFVLRRSNHMVTLIDVDSLKGDLTENKNAFDNYPFNEFNVITRDFGFGGTSNLWHGVLTDFDKIDLERIEEKCGNINWLKDEPDDLCYELLPGLKKLYSKRNNYLKTKYLGNSFNEEWEEKKYLIPSKPLRARNLLKYLNKRYRDRLVFIEKSIALKLKYKVGLNGINKVNSVVVISEKKEINIYADNFVCSLGALETPRLLMQSFQNERNLLKFIGKGLLEHPYAIISKIKYFKRKPSIVGQNSFFSRNKIRFGYKSKNLIDNRNIALGIVPTRKSIKELFKKKINYFSTNTDPKSKKVSYSTKEIVGASLPYISGKLGLDTKTKFHEVIYHHEVLNSDYGFISFKDEKDEYGRFKVNYNYPNLSSFYSQISFVQNLLLEDKKFNSFNIVSNLLLENIQINPGSHYAGTCRMSDRLENGICDRNLKCHNFHNLFICDASIFPVIGTANLGLSILKAASFLSKSF